VTPGHLGRAASWTESVLDLPPDRQIRIRVEQGTVVLQEFRRSERSEDPRDYHPTGLIAFPICRFSAFSHKLGTVIARGATLGLHAPAEEPDA
jgi:hypothetical protein